MIPHILKTIEALIHTSLLALGVVVILTSEGSAANGFYIDRRLGFDISYPQCNKAFPQGHTFAVIGINGGRPFTQNPCLKEQYTWARQARSNPAVYFNLSSPTPRFFVNVFKGPHDCSLTDQDCQAYNWGYQAAKYAKEYAQKNKVETSNWWLDIEIMNTWDEDKVRNAKVIQGAIDYLHQQKIKPGVYSTGYQWNKIAGDYHHGLPVWTAGAKNREHAMTYCTPEKAFGGGTVVMVQWIEDNFDNNFLCPLS